MKNTNTIPLEFTCADCKQTKPTQTSGGTGYARTDNGDTICYACCAERDKADMREHGRMTGYIVKNDGRYVFTNWPGTLLIPIRRVRKTESNWPGVQRTSIWFAFEGFIWFGVNQGDNDICRARKTKTEAK